MAGRQSELLRGTLDVMILKAVSWGPQHGAAIADWIQRNSDDTLEVEEGSLYPALHRLELKGWVFSEWGRSATMRHAKYYSLTADGQLALREQISSFQRTADAVRKVVSALAF